MNDILDGLLDQAYLLMIGLLVVLIVWTVIYTYTQRRSWVAAAGMALGGALVLWMAVNLVRLGGIVDDTVTAVEDGEVEEDGGLPEWEELESGSSSGDSGDGDGTENRGEGD